ncbi:galactose-1-phosphate uridylyltransferase [Deinococcus yavapaiensis]|uniref:Galactose-1-phosphate uridylyltransferase n=1 Tax=Deinococcus yavapaiensis KR-236 TaxID=694435 RepID=A0A318S6R9_9DEIO|nr:galactose-1-phosphate uridylyltransferase [Deinococcus yavapaiensis]PYE54464.1 UDPglucose--hexose-1-phosphate uridylyltransferase [Deinococcus yavapaiensis KR-236]
MNASSAQNSLPPNRYERAEYVKPDGRKLWLYSRTHIDVGDIPSPSPEAVAATPHLRWHPLRGEWVIYAAYRQNRPFLPPPNYNPLAPTRDPENPTELPQGAYDVAVFENRFPSLVPEPGPAPTIDGTLTADGVGACEVVVYSQDPNTNVGELDASHVELLVDVWADRTTRLAERGLAYVLPFENRGVEVGVTLHHPHGQIYAYDFLPPVQVRTLQMARAHRESHGEAWLETFVRTERAASTRVVTDAGEALSVVPPFARYAFETWIVPARAATRLSDLSQQERRAFAALISDTVRRFDALFEQPMPYLMTIHQAPTDGTDYPEWPLHIEFYPYLRAKGKLKYLAGTEQGAGVFANDALPEAKAAELRAVKLPGAS